MVDFQRKTCDSTTKLDQIIANLKQQLQRDEDLTNSCGTRNNSKNRSCFSKVCKENKSDSSNSNTQPHITDYFTVTKTALVNRSSNDLTIWSLLHTLKENKESGLGDKYSSEVPKNITDTNNRHSFNRKTDISLGNTSSITRSNGVINGKKKNDGQLNTSTEIVRKTCNYQKRQDTKRLKVCNNTNLLTVTDFFKVDHKAILNKPFSKIINVEKVDDKNLIKNAGFDMNIRCEQENYIKETNKNILSNKKQTLQNSRANAERKVFQNKKEDNRTSFDDFCNNIVKEISENSNKMKNIETEKGQERHPTSNTFPKSFSTGTLSIKTQRGVCKDLNSLPVTDLEVKSRREKLTQNKISFEDILKELRESKSYEKNDIGNMESFSCSDEKNNIECGNKIKDLIGKLKNESKEAPSEATNSSMKLHPTTLINKKSYQRSPNNISQKLNSFDSANTMINNETNYVKSLNDTTNKVGRNDLKETMSEDVLSYFPKSWNASKQLVNEPLVELPATHSLTGTDCSKPNDYTLTSVEKFPLNICSEILPEMPQDDLNVMQINNLNGKDTGFEGGSCFTHCTYEFLNFTESNTTYIDSNNQNNKNAIEREPFSDSSKDNLLENNLVIVGSERISEPRTYRNIKLDNLLEKLLKQNTLRSDTFCGKNTLVSRRTCIKRYRKGKTKIYRLNKLKKAFPKTKSVEHKENLNFDDIFRKITQDVCSEKIHLSRSKSMSSVSTTSSYITDLSRSEILSTGSNELSSPKQRLRKGFNELCKDKSLLYCKEQWENTEHEKEEIKIKIQGIITKVVEDFTKKDGSSLKYRKQSFENCIFKDGRLQLRPMAESSMTVINSKSQRSQSKFTLIFYLLKKIQNLLETDTKLTKRELYYQLKTLIKDQRVTDRAINAISCLLNVGMWALNIVAQKGMVFGDLKILLSSGETLNCNIPGTLIPQDINDIVEIASPAYFILVVEKESIFSKLIEEDLPNRLTRPFIMVTGKGFPDLNTQLFLKKLWMIMSVPVFILVDADPHGINIMLNYRFGSVNNAHVSHQLAIPNAKWLGVYPSEVINLNITREPLSERELKLVNQLLKTPYMDCNPKIVDELKVLLETKCKAEIEGLIKSDTYLSEVYLPNKFFTHNFI